MKKILLDTNAYTGLLSGDEAILAALSDADTVFMSIFVLGELHAGFRGGSREAANRAQLSDFLQRSTVRLLPATDSTAEVFGELKHRLKTAGKPIPINDLWIASQAIENGARLVTYDTHFSQVPGLLPWLHT